MVHKALIMLTSVLLLTNLLFLANSLITPSVNINCCIASAIILHYFLLVAFLLMLIVSVTQYLTFVKIFNYHIEHFMVKSSIFAFGLPIMVPLTISCLDPRLYVNNVQSVCWLYGTALYISFITPISVVSLVNLAFFIVIIVNIFKKPNVQIQTYRKSSNCLKRNQIGASLSCFVIMGTLLIFKIRVVNGEISFFCFDA